MIFPQMGPQYLADNNLDRNNKSVLARMDAFYSQSITINQSFWSEADLDCRFETGDATLWNDYYANVPANRRKQFNFNRIRPVINMISGYQRRNRKSTTVVGVENADNQTADQLTKTLIWINNQENFLETLSDAFHASLVTGMSLVQLWMDYRNDPMSGDIRADVCHYNSFLIDPYFMRADLLDCSAIWKRSWMTKRDVLSLMPDYTDEILGMLSRDTRDGRYQFMPQAYDYGMQNLLTYDEFWYRDYRKQNLLIDTVTGETTEWRGKAEQTDQLKEWIAHNPRVALSSTEIPTVRCAIVVQGRVMYDGANPMGIDDYPFVPVFAYYNPQMPYFPSRIQGVTRGLRDTQFLFTRKLITMADILESQINSGFKFKENALVDPKDIYLTGQGRGLALKEEAQMTDVEQILPPNIPAGVFQLTDMFGSLVQQISGVNEELLGSAQDEKAGILSMLRQGAGLTTLQPLFDNLDRAQKLLGKRQLDLIRANFMPGKITKILEEEPTAWFSNLSFGKYDCAIEEGLNTTTQKQMQFGQMLQLIQAGVPIPADELLECSTFQNKNRIIEKIQKQQEQQMQMQQIAMQAEMQEQQSRVKLAQSTALANEGLGLERISRVQENRALAARQYAEAEKDRQMSKKEAAEGILALARAIKEIQGINLDNITKAVNIIQMVEQPPQQEMANAYSQPA